MSKLSVISLVANIATTVGIATPMGIKINKERQSGGWNAVTVDDKQRKRTFGTGSLTKPEEKATQELYDWICHEDIYKKNINIKRFCLVDHKDNDNPDKITLEN